MTVVDEKQYKQHNPMTKEGDIGLAELFARLAKTNPHVEIIRIFSDGDYVFAHTEYDFSSVKICFEVFRFEGEKTVEHWDNLQLKQPPNASGHSMVDGATEVTDLEATKRNRDTVESFIQEVLIAGDIPALPGYFDKEHYTEHSPEQDDDINNLIKRCQPKCPMASHAFTIKLFTARWPKAILSSPFVKATAMAPIPPFMICSGWKTARLSSTGTRWKPFRQGKSGITKTGSSDFTVIAKGYCYDA